MKAKMLLFLALMVLPALACGEATPEKVGEMAGPTEAVAEPTSTAAPTATPTQAPISTPWPTDTPRPPSSPEPTVSSTPLPQVWISGYESCPSSAEYGVLVAEYANLYSSRSLGLSSVIERIPHGSQIEILEDEDSEGLYRVRYKGREGYVQSIMVVEYDPAEGLRPDGTKCL